VFEEVIVPCHGRRLEEEALPALSRAVFAKDLEPLGAFVRGLTVGDPAVKAAIDKGWQEVRNHVLHGQIDYGGKGPLPEHWKQFIDQDANLYDWRHPKWAKDAERLLIDATIHTARVDGWDGRAHPEPRTTAGFVDLLMELGEALPEAKPYADKFLEGLPEWLQHDNAYTGGYLTEAETAALHGMLEGRQQELKGRLKAGPVVGSFVAVLARAKDAGVGISWTVPGMTR
jgi:hypothetical protein